MHHEECEKSWQQAGFRILDKTTYLACCADSSHKCWDSKEQDAAFDWATEEVETPAVSTTALYSAVLSASGPKRDAVPDRLARVRQILEGGFSIAGSQ